MTDTVHWRQAQEALAKGDITLAIASLKATVAADPANLEAYRTLGRILRLSGKPDEAAEWYRRCLDVAPRDAISVMGLAALGRGPAPPRLPDEVVHYVFDRNAESYEPNMQHLGYRVPEVLAGLLCASAGAEQAALDVLDLGCGSGLCAPLFRRFARTLTGVDLSPRMLAIARGKNLYGELIEGELLDYLRGTQATFDVVVAANVLMYFGDLAPLADGVARVLRPGGRFLFDVEKGEGADPGFNVSGRYTHSLSLLRRTLPQCGLVLTHVEEVVMRREHGTPVVGLCCEAAKREK